MKKQFMLIVLLFLSLNGYTQTIDCGKFKNGKFYNNNYPIRVSVRNDTLQEGYLNNKLDVVFKVKWLNECEYELTCIKSLGNVFFKEGNRISNKIISSEVECYEIISVLFNDENPEGTAPTKIEYCLKKD